MTARPRELLLLRHGRSDWSVSSDDFHRPLRLKGKRDEALWLRRCLYYLDKRFHGWLRVHLIAPMSLPGLVKVIRYRVRTYPTFIMGGQPYTGHNLEELEAFIRRQAGEM